MILKDSFRHSVPKWTINRKDRHISTQHRNLDTSTRWHALLQRDETVCKPMCGEANHVDALLKVDAGAEPLAKFIHDRGARNWLP